MNVDILGYIGTFILGVTLLPQVFKTFSEKKANDLSFSYLFLQLNANIIFITYGFFLKSLPIMISNGIVLMCSSSLIYAKFSYREDDVYSPIDF